MSTNNIYNNVLFDYQKTAFDYLKDINKHMIALDMGLGKTITSLALLEHWFMKRDRKLALILCQKSKIIDWVNEVRKAFPKIKILKFSSKTISIKDVRFHRKNLNSKKIPSTQSGRLKLICDYYKNKHVIIISSYTLARLRNDYIGMIFNYSMELMSDLPHNFAFIVDESQIMKSRFSKIGIWGEKVSKAAKYVSLLSGDPISNSYLDLFQQMKLLGMKNSWNEWSWAFCILEKKTSYQKEWYEFVGFKNVDKLLFNLKRRAVFLKTEACLDYLPQQNWNIMRTIENAYPLEILKKHKALNSDIFKSPISFFLAQR